MIYDVMKLPPKIVLGKAGENKYNSIQIDVSQWNITGATYSIVYQRPDGTAYPVTVTSTNNILTWMPTATDLTAGAGKIEVRMYKDEVIAKSITALTYCYKSINAGTAPAAKTPDWVQEIIDAYEQISPATTSSLGLVKVDGTTITVDANGKISSVGGGGGGGGTTDYSALSNKPKINNVTLSGNKSLADLGINNFDGNYNSLTNKPTIPTTSDIDTEVATYWNAHKAELKGDKGDAGATYTITSADYDAIATVVLGKLTNAESVSV